MPALALWLVVSYQAGNLGLGQEVEGFTARNLRNMRAFYLAFPIWHALRAELRLLEKGQLARDQLPTVEKLSALRRKLFER